MNTLGVQAVEDETVGATTAMIAIAIVLADVAVGAIGWTSKEA